MQGLDDARGDAEDAEDAEKDYDGNEDNGGAVVVTTVREYKDAGNW
jgi:hypothetical protein